MSQKNIPHRGRGHQAHLPVNLDLSQILPPEWVEFGAWWVSTIVFHRFGRGAHPDDWVPADSRYIDKHVGREVTYRLREMLVQAGVIECDYLKRFGSRYKRGKCFCYQLGEKYRYQPIKARPYASDLLLDRIERAYTKAIESIEENANHQHIKEWSRKISATPDAPRGLHPLLDGVIDGRQSWSVCEQRRCHHNLTNLPAQCRQYIRLDGHRLVAVDIVASQPNLLRQFAKNHPKYFQQEDVAYAAACQNDPYNVVVERCGLDRCTVKKRFLTTFYCHPRDRNTKVGRAMMELFPDIMEGAKRFYWGEGHGALPRALQAFEADFIYGRVVERIRRERPEMPVITVHDAVLVSPEFAEYARTVVEEEWRAAFGESVRVKVEEWTSPQEARSRKHLRKKKATTTQNNHQTITHHPSPTSPNSSPNIVHEMDVRMLSGRAGLVYSKTIGRYESSEQCASHPYPSVWTHSWLTPLDWLVETLQIRQGKGPRASHSRVAHSVRYCAATVEGGLPTMVAAVVRDPTITNPLEAARGYGSESFMVIPGTTFTDPFRAEPTEVLAAV